MRQPLIQLGRVRFLTALACLAVAGPTCLKTALAADAPQLEIHDISVWLGDPTVEHYNNRNRYPNAMPSSVRTARQDADSPDEMLPAPFAVITFYGDPVDDFEIDLQLKNGRFLAHWPPARSKSKRMRWYGAKLVTQLDNEHRLAHVPDTHLFDKLRSAAGLYLRQEAHAERFLAYDAELYEKLPMKLRGGPDRYQAINTGKFPLHDLLIVAPEGKQLRVGWLEELPAAKIDTPPDGGSQKEAVAETGSATKQMAPAASTTTTKKAPASKPEDGDESDAKNDDEAREASGKNGENAENDGDHAAGVEIVMSSPLARGSAELANQTSESLERRLQKAGLTEAEAHFLVERYAKTISDPDKLIVSFCIPQSELDTQLPLAFYPESAKLIRVGLVIVFNLDPKVAVDVDNLITQLGNEDYAVRQAAHEKLVDLGSIAVPALEKAKKNPDMEIVIRAERILQQYKQNN